MLSFFMIILLGANLLGLVLSMIKSVAGWFKWYIPLLALTAILHLIIDGFYQTFIPVYGVTLILIALCALRWKQPLPEGKGFFRKVWAVFWRFLCILCLIVAMGLTWYQGKNNTLVSGSHFHHSDFSDLGWSEAFDEMSILLERDYAFGEWKRIDWDSLYEEYAGKVADAEKSGDGVAYYKAIREYALSLPDGHVSVQGNDYGLEKAHTEGGFGFAMVQLDDGRVVVSVMDEGCPAEEKGLKWGAEIIRWNELPVLTAIDQVPYKWVAPMPCSTLESLNLRKTLYLARAPLNRSVSVTFRNPDEIEERVITLTSYDDSAVAVNETNLLGYPLPERYVEWSILPNGYGYLKISGEIPTPSLIHPVGEVRRAVKSFTKAGVPGVILDLRYNIGGFDDMAPLMMSFFTDEPLFYERVVYRNKETGEFEVIGDMNLIPSKPSYTGPVAMLISNNTGSTGEGFPLIMQSLHRGPVLGFYGTNGSFGMIQGSVQMPGGTLVKYPNGIALDQDENILIDSDHTLQSRNRPDVRVPLDMEAIQAIYIDGEDYLLDQAIALLDKK